MNYSKIEKFIAILLISVTFISLIFNLPPLSFFSKTSAGDKKLYNIVSILVDNSIYSGVQNSVKEYAINIQSQLENTRVIIVPTPKNASPFKISSLNENLFYEGYKGIKSSANFQSKLVGTVLIGKINIPVVSKGKKSAKTILPYTDFIDKKFIFNHKKNKYQVNTNNQNGAKPEIWHGLINPNTGNRAKDILAINNYFKKNNDFYKGKGNFKIRKGIINGKRSDKDLQNYKPYVFYFDQFREQVGVSYSRYKGYEAYLDNKEDIVYQRFSKELADRVKNAVNGAEKDKTEDLIKDLRLDVNLDDLSKGPDVSKASDISTRFITNNSTKKFLEVINSSLIGEFRKNVNNAGRYSGTGSKVNVDFIPHLMSVLDVVGDEIIKGVNNDLEVQIDNLVKGGLSRKIAIPTKIYEKPQMSDTSDCEEAYENILFGKLAQNITKAEQCSIYRGSSNLGTLVEANRGLNIKLVKSDLEECSGGKTSGYYGGNSPINLNREKSSNGVLELGEHNLNKSIRPIFDIVGSKKIEKTKIGDIANSPLDCLDNNYFLSYRKEDFLYGFSCRKFNLPIDIGDIGEIDIDSSTHSCGTDNTLIVFKKNFSENYKEHEQNRCKKREIYLDGNKIITGEIGDSCSGIEKKTKTSFYYKTIPSYIEHKSPSLEEIGIEIKNPITPSLPIDKNRYVDFISAKGNHEKIFYPYLFRLRVNLSNYNTLESQLSKVGLEIDKYLDKKSAEINVLIRKSNPLSLSGVDLEIYNLLKTGVYPNDNFDLKFILKSKSTKKLISNGDGKDISYYDMLVFSIFWNSLDSVPQKYKFIFENYLVDQFSNNNKFNLPKNKKIYEIAYLGAPGDAQNMFIKLDPEDKGKNPYSSINSANANLNTQIFSSRVNFDRGVSSSRDEPVFKCAPPEGVVLWKWIPAVTCRLKDLLPAKINLSSSRCSSETLFSKDEKKDEKSGETNNSCGVDNDKNGISDCLEKDFKSSKIISYSNNLKTYYNKTVDLNIKLVDNNGKINSDISGIKSKFELIKVEVKKDNSKDLSNGNIKIIYSLAKIKALSNGGKNKIKYELLKKEGLKKTLPYLVFKEQNVRLTKGISKYFFSVKNKDANFYFKGIVYVEDKKNKKIKKVSNVFQIKVRGELFSSGMKVVGKNGNILDQESILVSSNNNVFIYDEYYNNGNFDKSVGLSTSSKNSIVFNLINRNKNKSKIKVNYPLRVSLFKEGKLIKNEILIKRNQLNGKVFGFDSLKKSGEYKIIISDRLGTSISKTFNVLPEKVKKLEVNLGSNIIESGNNITSNVIIFKDKFGNVASGESYEILLSLTGGGLVFPSKNNNGSYSVSFKTSEGFKVFRIKSTSKNGNNSLFVKIRKNNKIILQKRVLIDTISNLSVNYEIEGNKKLVVGRNEYKINLEIGGKKLNSRVYFTIDSKYGKLNKPYSNIRNGKADFVLETATLAGNNIPIELKIEGKRGIVKKYINIFPGKAMKIDMILSKSKMEASNSDFSELKIELKDKFNNLVFNDNSTSLSIELKDRYKKIVKFDSLSKVVKKGIAKFKIHGTSSPGTAYFKIGTSPDLKNNAFTIGKGDKKIIIRGVGENAGKIQTYFFWNKNTFKNKKYNSIYSVLLGSNYGDVTQKDYLAGSILFDKNNRSLAVTSMLNNPYKFNDVLNIGGKGNIKLVVAGNDLSQDLDLKVGVNHNNRLYIDLYNKALNTFIGKIFYETSNNTLLKTCVGGGIGFKDCNIESGNSTIGIKSNSAEFSVSSLGSSLKLLDTDNTPLIEINKLGEIKLNGLVKIEIDEENNEEYLVLNLTKSGNIIGKIAISIINKETIVSRNKVVTKAKLNNKENVIIIGMESYLYGTNLTKENGVIYYKDPFKSNKQLNEFVSENTFGIENFEKKKGLGWEEENKFLLAFSAGKNIGEATQKYMSFGMINLGDPVISLKKKKVKFNDNTTIKSFDATIGKRLTKDENINSYQIFDYDNDKNKDILLMKSDGYFKLLENKNSKFIDKGNLAYVIDLGDRKKVKTGDFTGDGFDDIFFINKKGKPFLLNNRTKDFLRIDLSDQFTLDGKITQVEKFDMDNDGKMDIITLDDSGAINIFYGGGVSISPKFTKKFIGSGFGLKLNSTVRNSGAAIYFDGLYQINKRDYSNSTGSTLNESMIDRLVFESISYGKKKIINEDDKSEQLVANIPELNSTELGGSSEETIKALKNLYSSNSGSISVSGRNSTDIKTFIKSEYSNIVGLKVEKFYKDLNGGNLQAGDIVEVEVKLKNISTRKLKNIAYIDKVTKPFKAINGSVSILKDEGTEGVIPSGFDFMFHKFSLESGESFVIKYKLVTKGFRVGYIKVGQFERKDEVGFDKFGDIIIKPNRQNCSEVVDMFRSHNFITRKYSKGKQEPVCDESKLKLPDILEKNKIDINPKNGIPDYLDEIKSDPNKQKEYAKKQLEELNKDSDGDGIPDTDDLSINYNNNSLENGFLDNLNRINQDVDKMTEQVDNLLEGFACGFGGGGCITTPLNWAPLLPGQDPTLMGYPIGDGNKVSEGIPIFSAFTTGCPYGACTWPPFSGGAGGQLGTTYPGNVFRINISPTLTGAMGSTFCFGQPSVAGNLPPSGISPIVPAGTCIVTAKPLIGCSNDGENGDPESLGGAEEVGKGANSFGVLNGNCAEGMSKKEMIRLNKEFLEEYIKYKRKKKKGINISQAEKDSLKEKYVVALKRITSGSDRNWFNKGANMTASERHERMIRDRNGNSGPLFSFNGGGVGEGSLEVSLNFSNIFDGEFEDIIEIQQKRVSDFPSFLMDWVTRQIEEFVTKLTDLPTLYVIIPDFSGITDVDSWTEYLGKGTKKSYSNGVNKEKAGRKKIQNEIELLNKRKVALKCEIEVSQKCAILDIKISNKHRDLLTSPAREAMSGVRQVYKFLGNIPLVSVSPQQVNIEIPWITERTISKTLNDWNMAKKQYQKEIDDWKKSSVVINAGIDSNVDEFLGNIDKNIQILEERKKFPEKLSKLLNQKNIRLEQILCNIESISEITSGWIGFNGKRFKAWVETYILIKAILKSWQAVIDLFVDYEAECHECKNERSDLLDFEFKLISMILPKIPVIKFPKWPDIILDIHNIRAGITIMVPDININYRPIILPSLPRLILPRVNLSANLDIKLPDVPLLPKLPDLPDLPDLPSLPSIELPNLPPPFKLPKLFPSLEGIIKILKLITKAMCILKTSPFVPEWRAGDQVAFLTERNGYLPTDFIDMSLPEFSFPFVDAIKVTSYVNLEFETEFLTELVKSVVEPINSTTANILNAYSNVGLDDLDFSNYGININVNGKIDKNGASANGSVSFTEFTKLLLVSITNNYSYIKKNKNEEIDAKEFLSLVNKSLIEIIKKGDPRTAKIEKIWNQVNNYDYKKEDKLIADLQKNNKEKFNAIKKILSNEIRKTNQLKKQYFESIKENKTLFRKISYKEDTSKDFIIYKKSLNKYNENFRKSAEALILGGSDENSEDKIIKAQGERLLSQAKIGIKNYTKIRNDKLGIKVNKDLGINSKVGMHSYSTVKNNLLAITGGGSTDGDSTQNACQQANNSEYKYKYEGLYIVEKQKSYRLFNYLDELNGDEITTSIDFDKDGDEDLLYMTSGNLYLKENLSNKSEKTFVGEAPLVINISENKFFKTGGIFIEAVNGVKEINADVNSINLSFNAPTDNSIKHFRLEYYSIIDKFLNKGNTSYIPNNISKHTIDAIVDMEDAGEESTGINVKHSAYISYVGEVNGLSMVTSKMENISSKKNVIITSGTRIYSSNSSAKIKYHFGEETSKIKELVINANSSVGFGDNISIDSVSGNIFVKSVDKIILNGTQEIASYMGFPFFSDTKIKINEVLHNVISNNAKIEISYANGGSKYLNFRKTNLYEIYDLGNWSSDYLIKVDRPNDYYYAKLYAIKDGIKGTYSRQILLSPQKEADDRAPELSIFGSIKIPVYQKRKIDLTKNINENSGVSGVKDMKIDFDLDIDSDGDGNSKNDNDTTGINIIRSNTKIEVEFGKFDKLMKKKIGVILTDKNGNTSFTELSFEVYAPIPNISKTDNGLVYGNINEKLSSEPVNLYRLRGGIISKIDDKVVGSKVDTVNTGGFNFNIDKDAKGLVLKIGTNVIATVDEFSGKISIQDRINYHLEVKNNDTYYPKIVLSDNFGKEIYYEYIKIIDNINIFIVNTMSSFSEKGIYLRFNNNGKYNYYKIPNGMKYAPGAIAIYKNSDSTKKPIFIIFPDGRIKINNKKYSVIHKEYANNVGFLLISRIGNKKIAELLYNIDGSYLME